MCCTRLAGNIGRKNRHFGTIAQLCRAISSQIRHVSTIGKKLVKQRYVLHMSWQYGELRPTNGWDLLASLGHPCNFNGFRVLAALLHGTLVVGVSQTLRRWTEGATYIRQGGHHVGHWPTFLVIIIAWSVLVNFCRVKTPSIGTLTFTFFVALCSIKYFSQWVFVLFPGLHASFWSNSMLAVVPVLFGFFSSLFGVAPVAPITFQNPLSSHARSSYLSTFSCYYTSILVCLRALRSRVSYCCPSLRLQYLVVCLRSVLIFTSQRIFTSSVSVTGSAICRYRCFERGRPYFSRRLQWTIPATLSCLFL